MEILRLVIQGPGGKFLPVGKHTQNHILRNPVKEQLACSWILLARTPSQGYAVQLLIAPGPCSGGTNQGTFAAAYAAAGVLVNLAVLVQAQHACCMVLAGVHAGTAANTAVNVINLLVDAHDAEVVEIGLNTVIGTSGHSHFNMVMGWEYQALNLSGQLVCIGIALDAVGVSDTGHDIPGADGGVTVIRHIHVHAAHLHVHVMDI